MAHTAFETSLDTLLEEPKLYCVSLLNDDYTAMDFVTRILIEVFDKTPDEATSIMLRIHNKGKGVCGVYTYDIAELKSQIVSQKARELDYPLQVIIEEMPS